MTHDHEQGYPEPPAVEGEVATLRGSVERQRPWPGSARTSTQPVCG